MVFSVKMTSIANTLVILSATPAVSAVFSWVLLGEATNRLTWAAIVSVVGGIVVVVSGSSGSGNFAGDALVLLSLTCLSLLFTLLRKYQNVGRLASVGLGAFFLAAVMFFFAAPSTYTMSTWLIMGIMGLFTAPFGRVLSMVATRYITAPEVSMTLMLETVLASTWAFIFFREVPPTESILGGGIILVTIFFYTLSTMGEEENDH